MSDEKRTGDLCDADTLELIRPATADEVIASRVQAWHDGGPGAIVVDGRKCYVEGDDDPELEVCVSKEWLKEWLWVRMEVDGGDYGLECAAAWCRARLCELLDAADFTTTGAKGGRSTLNGWDGVNVYPFQTGPVGTFAQLGDAEKAKVVDLIDQSLADTAAEWAGDK